jgi:hypothetical protein
MNGTRKMKHRKGVFQLSQKSQFINSSSICIFLSHNHYLHCSTMMCLRFILVFAILLPVPVSTILHQLSIDRTTHIPCAFCLDVIFNSLPMWILYSPRKSPSSISPQSHTSLNLLLSISLIYYLLFPYRS